jgi:murein DD-endopeptidase MepM/ murein hydrolase activator NlpD
MRGRITYIVAGAIALMLTTQVAVQAQQPCGVLGCPTPHPTATPTGTLTPPPSESPGATPEPSGNPKPSATLPPLPGQTTKPPTKTSSPTATPSATPGFDGIDSSSNLPPDLQKGFDLQVPDIPRTLPSNSTKLVELLEPLTQLGLPLEQVLVEGMGRFPIAGLAYWHDDWLEPRMTPVPHLHHGLDLFADFGTPIRAVDDGTVTMLNDPEGWGNGVDLKAKDGTEYIFAHMQSVADNLKAGDSVKLGQVIGYVGNTGNAQGGPPHCHFEVHKPDAIPPKPFVDKWLADAIKAAPAFVAMRRAQILGIKGGAAAPVARSDASLAEPKGSLDASMVLTLLDPVGGSVGLLPKLQLERAKRPEISNALLQQIIRNRIGGYLFAPNGTSGHLSD